MPSYTSSRPTNRPTFVPDRARWGLIWVGQSGRGEAVKRYPVNKFIMMFCVVLCGGLLLGVGFATLGRFTLSTDPAQEQALQRVPLPDTSTTMPRSGAPIPESMKGFTSTSDTQQPSKVALLRTQLDEEAAARQRLEEEVHVLRDTLKLLEQRLDDLTEPKAEDRQQEPRSDDIRQVEEVTFIAAGFAPDEAAFLTDRWGQQQMELLYLRNQAMREGWINTPQYSQEVRELRSGVASMREEIGLDSYDRFLFATGQSNRIVVNSVIDSSPAQAIGLQPGDTIFSYDSNRMFSVGDLRAATTVGEPDVSVVMEVIRGGQLIAFEITRGPVGVTLGTARIEP